MCNFGKAPCKQDCDDLTMCCGQSIWSCIFVLWQWRLILLFICIYLYCYYSISNSINSCNSTYYAILYIMDTKMLSWIVMQNITWPQGSHNITGFFKQKQEIDSGALLAVTNDNMYFNKRNVNIYINLISNYDSKNELCRKMNWI